MFIVYLLKQLIKNNIIIDISRRYFIFILLLTLYYSMLSYWYRLGIGLAINRSDEMKENRTQSGNKTQSEQLKYALKQNPCTSYWLKDAITAVDNRDPVDALKDCKFLVLYLNTKVREIESVL